MSGTGVERSSLEAGTNLHGYLYTADGDRLLTRVTRRFR